ncbi:MAG: hypothetical protein IT318_24515 [Anaerolineales bacterium]|nr:hypothetical protein [Anaerolineales bacterium]
MTPHKRLYRYMCEFLIGMAGLSEFIVENQVEHMFVTDSGLELRLNELANWAGKDGHYIHSDHALSWDEVRDEILRVSKAVDVFIDASSQELHRLATLANRQYGQLSDLTWIQVLFSLLLLHVILEFDSLMQDPAMPRDIAMRYLGAKVLFENTDRECQRIQAGMSRQVALDDEFRAQIVSLAAHWRTSVITAASNSPHL